MGSTHNIRKKSGVRKLLLSFRMDVKKGYRKSSSYSPELVYIKTLSELKDWWKPARLIKVWIRLLMDAASLQRKYD